jgi:hypothetical protein
VLRLPTSHRARVRLLWISIAVTAVLAVAGLIVFVPNTGHSFATPIVNKPAMVVTEPKHVPATPATRRAAEATLRAFVRSAIVRRDLARSWPLATAHMKIGTSRADWLHGNLPVVPYPANAFADAGFTLKYSYVGGVLGYDVLIIPRENAAGNVAGQQVYSCELHDVRGRWLVDFCYPRKTL